MLSIILALFLARADYLESQQLLSDTHLTGSCILGGKIIQLQNECVHVYLKDCLVIGILLLSASSILDLLIKKGEIALAIILPLLFFGWPVFTLLWWGPF